MEEGQEKRKHPEEDSEASQQPIKKKRKENDLASSAIRGMQQFGLTPDDMQEVVEQGQADLTTAGYFQHADEGEDDTSERATQIPSKLGQPISTASTSPSPSSSKKSVTKMIPQEPGYKGLIGIKVDVNLSAQQKGLKSAAARSQKSGQTVDEAASDESALVSGDKSAEVTIEEALGSKKGRKVKEIQAADKGKGKLIEVLRPPQQPQFILYNPATKQCLRVFHPSHYPGLRKQRLQDHSCFMMSLHEIRQGAVQAAFSSPLTDEEFRTMDITAMRYFFPSIITKELELRSTTARDIKRDAHGNFRNKSAVSFDSDPVSAEEAMNSRLNTYKQIRTAADKAIAKIETYKTNYPADSNALTQRQQRNLELRTKEITDMAPDMREIYHEVIKDLAPGERTAFVDAMHNTLMGTAEFYREGLAAAVVYGNRLREELSRKTGILIDIMTTVQNEIKYLGKFELEPWMISQLAGQGFHHCECSRCRAYSQPHDLLQNSLFDQMTRKMEEEAAAAAADDTADDADLMAVEEPELSEEAKFAAQFVKMYEPLMEYSLVDLKILLLAVQKRIGEEEMAEIETAQEEADDLEQKFSQMVVEDNRPFNWDETMNRANRLVDGFVNPTVQMTEGDEKIDDATESARRLIAGISPEERLSRDMQLMVRHIADETLRDPEEVWGEIRTAYHLFPDSHVVRVNEVVNEARIMPTITAAGARPGPCNLMCCGNNYELMEDYIAHQEANKETHLDEDGIIQWLAKLSLDKLDVPETVVTRSGGKDYTSSVFYTESSFPRPLDYTGPRPIEYCAESLNDFPEKQRYNKISLRIDRKWMRVNTPTQPFGGDARSTELVLNGITDPEEVWNTQADANKRLRPNAKKERIRIDEEYKLAFKKTMEAEGEKLLQEHIKAQPTAATEEERLQRLDIEDLRDTATNEGQSSEAESTFRRMEKHPEELFTHEGSYLAFEEIKDLYGIVVETRVIDDGLRFDRDWNLWTKDGAEKMLDAGDVDGRLLDNVGSDDFSPTMTIAYVLNLAERRVVVSRAGVLYIETEIDELRLRARVAQRWINFCAQPPDHTEYQYAMSEGFHIDYVRQRNQEEFETYTAEIEKRQQDLLRQQAMTEHYEKLLATTEQRAATMSNE